VIYSKRSKELSPIARSVTVLAMLGTSCCIFLAILEIIIVFLYHSDSTVSLWDVDLNVIFTPVFLYGLIAFILSLISGFLLGVLLGFFHKRLAELKIIIYAYALLTFLPVTILSIYLWKTRILPEMPFFTAKVILDLSLILLAYLSLFLTVRGAIFFVDKNKTTIATRLIIPAILLITGLALKGGWFKSFGREDTGSTFTQEGSPMNVLLVTMDTQRADYLGCYGDKITRTPNIDALASESAVFMEAYSQIPITLPSHLSIFTSTYPAVHGVRSNTKPRKMPGRLNTMAEIFKDHGYRTGAVVSAYILSSLYETARGFDTYDDKFENKEFYRLMRVKPKLTIARAIEIVGIKPDKHYERKANKTTSRAIGWLDELRDNIPFFLWVHYYDPHCYYNPPSPWDTLYFENTKNIDEIEDVLAKARTYFPKQTIQTELSDKELQVVDALYRGEVSFMDFHFGKLVSHLERKGFLDNTLIVLTADHGETIGEHNTLGHSMWLYRPIIHIPLLIYHPGSVPSIIVEKETVQSIDIMPTILDILNIPIPEQVQGRSLVPLFSGKSQETATAYFETLCASRVERRSVGVRFGPWKYIYHPWGDIELLFHLEDDPMEVNNLIAVETNLAEKMRKKAESYLAQGESAEYGEEIEQLPEHTDALRALGYIR
jgi:arylsulfatase A-like enzyme